MTSEKAPRHEEVVPPPENPPPRDPPEPVHELQEAVELRREKVPDVHLCRPRHPARVVARPVLRRLRLEEPVEPYPLLKETRVGRELAHLRARPRVHDPLPLL